VCTLARRCLRSLVLIQQIALRRCGQVTVGCLRTRLRYALSILWFRPNTGSGPGHLRCFNADAGIITLRESKAGKPRHVVLTSEGQRLFAEHTAGKLGDDPIFVRADGGKWGKSHQLRPMIDVSRRAKIKPAVLYVVKAAY
jgi:hypothetical protein